MIVARSSSLPLQRHRRELRMWQQELTSWDRGSAQCSDSDQSRKRVWNGILKTGSERVVLQRKSIHFAGIVAQAARQRQIRSPLAYIVDLERDVTSDVLLESKTPPCVPDRFAREIASSNP